MDLKEELKKLRNTLTGKKQEEQSTSRKTTVLKSELTEEYINNMVRMLDSVIARIK